MSYNFYNLNEFETIYSILDYDTSALTAASTTKTIFTSDANKGYCAVVSILTYVKTYDATNSATSTFSPRYGVVGGLANISPAFSLTPSNAVSGIATVNKGYLNDIVFSSSTNLHSIAPSTAVVLSNSNASVAKWVGTIHVFMRVMYFGI